MRRMMRQIGSLALMFGLLFVWAPRGSRVPLQERVTLREATIADLQMAMTRGRVTSANLVSLSLERIATFEDRVNAVITINPNALQEAVALDQERAAGKVRGPLHGIPIALKDNIHTTNMPTTGGALAFEALTPPYDATLTKVLGDAGAVMLVKYSRT